MTNQISPKKMTELDRNILSLIKSINSNPDWNPSDEFMDEFQKILSISVRNNTIIAIDDIVYLRILNDESSQLKT